MENVLKLKNMRKYFVTLLHILYYFMKIYIYGKNFFIKYFSFRTKVFFFYKKTYVLDHSGSFDMPRNMLEIKTYCFSLKTGFAVRGSRGWWAQAVANWSATNCFFVRLPFTDSFTQEDLICWKLLLNVQKHQGGRKKIVLYWGTWVGGDSNPL